MLHNMFVVILCGLTMMQNHFILKRLKLGRLDHYIWQDHASSKGAETGAESYELSPENEANILEESSITDVGMTNIMAPCRPMLGKRKMGKLDQVYDLPEGGFVY